MTDRNELWARLAGLARHMKAAPMPEITELEFSGVDESRALAPGAEIARDRDYFGLTLDRLWLAQGRKLFASFDPLVYVALDFTHGGRRITVPKLIGPSALKGSLPSDVAGLPHGFVVRDVRVAGPHPYRGEQVGVTVILYKVKQTDYARRVLALAEHASEALGLPADIATVQKIGELVVDAMESLFDLGDSIPVLGHHRDLNASPLEGFTQRKVALIQGRVAAGQVVPKDGGLATHGGERYVERDHVLYTVWGIPSNENESRMPFFPLVQKMYQCASTPDEQSWQRAKAMLMTIYQEMLGSPDLNAQDAERLFEVYKDEILRKRKTAKDVQMMSIAESKRGPAYKADVQAHTLNHRAAEIFSLEA